jgi:hypothetical protein
MNHGAKKMRIRNGFVSNSSSSSFIVLDEDLDKTARVALIMLCKVAEDYEDDGSEVADDLQRAMDFLMNNLDFDEPISFPWSINYDTFIWRRGNGSVFVDTCNNHSWYDDLDVDYSGEGELDNIYNERRYTMFLDLQSMRTVNGDYYYLCRWSGEVLL